MGASEEARHDAWVVQNSIHHTTWTPPADALAGAVERTLAASGSRGGVYDYATTDEGIAVWFWVDGYVQSSGALFSAPDASVRLCARLVVAREPTLKTAECAGKALPLPTGTRVISL